LTPVACRRHVAALCSRRFTSDLGPHERGSTTSTYNLQVDIADRLQSLATFYFCYCRSHPAKRLCKQQPSKLYCINYIMCDNSITDSSVWNIHVYKLWILLQLTSTMRYLKLYVLNKKLYDTSTFLRANVS